jgi:uncharacterized protein YktB (UPF0637 family)
MKFKFEREHNTSNPEHILENNAQTIVNWMKSEIEDGKQINKDDLLQKIKNKFEDNHKEIFDQSIKLFQEEGNIPNSSLVDVDKEN